jgi:hypothetical protein
VLKVLGRKRCGLPTLTQGFIATLMPFAISRHIQLLMWVHRRWLSEAVKFTDDYHTSYDTSANGLIDRFSPFVGSL